MRKALEEYEVLQHHGYNLRHLRQRDHQSDYDSDSQPEAGHDIEDEMTPDEESLEKQKSRQVEYIQQIEGQMYQRIVHD